MNPVNAYLFIKRLTRDWKQIKRLMNYNQADQFIKNITDGRVINAVNHLRSYWNPECSGEIPRWWGSWRCCSWLASSTGNLSAGNFGSGQRFCWRWERGEGIECTRLFWDWQSCLQSESKDTLELLCWIVLKDYYYTLEWMIEAMERDPSRELEIEILEYLAYALYQQGNQKRALALTKRLVEMAPDHPRAEGWSVYDIWPKLLFRKCKMVWRENVGRRSCRYGQFAGY